MDDLVAAVDAAIDRHDLAGAEVALAALEEAERAREERASLCRIVWETIASPELVAVLWEKGPWAVTSFLEAPGVEVFYAVCSDTGFLDDVAPYPSLDGALRHAAWLNSWEDCAA